MANITSSTISAVLAAAFPKTNSTLASTSLVIPIPASRTFIGNAYFPFNVTTGAGVKFQFNMGGAATVYLVTFELYDTEAGNFNFTDQLEAEASFGFVPAGLGNLYIKSSISITNGVTPTNLTLQFAQNTTDATASILLAGSYIAGIIV